MTPAADEFKEIARRLAEIKAERNEAMGVAETAESIAEQAASIPTVSPEGDSGSIGYGISANGIYESICWRPSVQINMAYRI